MQANQPLQPGDEGYRAPGDVTAVRARGLTGRNLRVEEVIRETADAVTLVLEDPFDFPFDYKPGQYFTVVLRIDGSEVRRSYSASSAPGDPRLRLTVKRTAGGVASMYITDRVRAGDQVEVRGPSGTFAVSLDPAARRETVLIAAGSGITPVFSIAQAVLAAEPLSRVTLLYGNRRLEDVIFLRQLAVLREAHPDRFVLRHVLTVPPTGWDGGSGRLDETTVTREIQALAPSDGAHFYLCGPTGMMQGARASLAALGVAAGHVHEERFVTAARPTTAELPTEEQLMTVERNGRSIASVRIPVGLTLLEAGVGDQVPMGYSCTAGTCGECMVRLTRGEVVMDESGALLPQDREQGYILACVARAVSAVTVELP